MSGEDSIKVAVRVRPFNQRERQAKTKCIIQMQGPSTTISHPGSGEARTFAFDHSYWSHDGFSVDSEGMYVGTGDKYADQHRVFRDLGRGVLANAWKGYNAALFAYGQTGSGKSYSMIGYGNNKGIVPITCDELFSAIKDCKEENKQFQVTFSMLEIYNEQVRDLLVPPATANSKASQQQHNKGGLRVRQNPLTGFYVQGLKRVAVQEYGQIEQLMEQGTRHRTTASTNMNATSSRSHMVITITFKQIYKNSNGESTTKSSEMNLVDLAGSERADSTGATGDRLKEGSNINQSLSTLGKVISALAEQSSNKSKIVVPYRDSVLTKLLQSAIGGNSKTIMIAALSPAAINYDETLSTLRYADRAKRIQNKAVINESPTDKMIRQLKEENQKLMAQLKMIQQAGGQNTFDIEERLARNIAQIESEDKSWEQRLLEARKEWEVSQISHLEENKGFAVNPYLQNINEDPQLSGVIKHCLPSGMSVLGKPGGKGVTIELRGLRIQTAHCKLVNDGSCVTIEPCATNAGINVNGATLHRKTKLAHLDRIRLGSSNFYLFVGYPCERSAKDDYAQYTYDYIQNELADVCGLSGSMLTPRVSTQRRREDDEADSLAMASVFQDYVDLLPKIDQVNAMSEDMAKGVTFEAQVKNLASYDATGQPKVKEVIVRVTNTYNKKVWIWSTGKFINRKFLIEEQYNKLLDEGGELHLPPDQDPFWDPVEDILLGTCHLWLHNMAYCLDSEDRLEMVDDRGEEVAKLQAKLVPCDKRGRTLKDERIVFDPHELLWKRFDFIVSIPQVSGLKWCMNDKSRGAYCQFLLFNHEHPQSTNTIKGSSEPAFKYKKQLTEPTVTEEFLVYLQSHALVIELWGTQSDDAKRQGSAEAKDRALAQAMELIGKLEEKIKRQDLSIQHLMRRQETVKRENSFLKQQAERGMHTNGNGSSGAAAPHPSRLSLSPDPSITSSTFSRRNSQSSLTSYSTQDANFEADVAKALKVFFKSSKAVQKQVEEVKDLNASLCAKTDIVASCPEVELQRNALDMVESDLSASVGTLKTTMMDIIRKKRQDPHSTGQS